MKQYIYETFFKIDIFNRSQWACSWVVGMSESIKRRGFLMGFVDNKGKCRITPALAFKLGTFRSAAYHNWTCTVISASSHLNDVNAGSDWQTCVKAAAGWRAKEGKNRVFHHILSPHTWQPLTCGLLWWMLLMAGRQSCTTFRPCKRCFFMEDCFLGDEGCVCVCVAGWLSEGWNTILWICPPIKTLKQSLYPSASSPQFLNWMLEIGAGVHGMSPLTLCPDRTGHQVLNEISTPVLLVR